jgi:threonine dehydratase
MPKTHSWTRRRGSSRSLQAGIILPTNNPHTIAVIQQYVQQIVTVSEEAIVSAMRYVWERMKIIIEPSAAVPSVHYSKRKSTSQVSGSVSFYLAVM